MLHQHGQVGELGDGLEYLLLIPQADVLSPLDPLRKFGDIGASLDLVTVLKVFESEHLLVLVAQVSEPETDTGTVLGGGPDHLTENLGDVQSFNLL